MYQRIMVPVDGSTFSEFAIPVALGIAQGTGAEVELVNVQAPLPAMAEDRWAASIEEWGMPYLEGLRDRIKEASGISVTITGLAGTVFRELGLHAEKVGADLVVMATHGRGPLSRFWIGSVADTFVRESKIPTLLVRPQEGGTPDFGTGALFRRVLVPLDGSPESETALEHALAIGKLGGASYRIIRVVQYPIEVVSPYLPDTAGISREVVEEGKKRSAEYLEGLRDRLAAEDLACEIDVRVEAQPAVGVLNMAREGECDLIVMSTHGRGGLSRTVLGSVADKVVRSSELPILVVRPGGEG